MQNIKNCSQETNTRKIKQISSELTRIEKEKEKTVELK